ncbi:MAG: hypothetical protein H0W62_05785 [Chitinophagales bacterium]|nr:hypothetical protein [Chitinophagales bacterium]
MRKSLSISSLYFILFLLLSPAAFAQRSSLGLSLGATSFFGDLGGANNYGKPLYHDFNAPLLKPAATITYLFSANSHIAFRGSFSFTQVSGNDNLLDSSVLFSPEWFRWYRNLSFRSNIMEASVIAEVNILDYRPGAVRGERWTPYIFAGIGVFHFNPQANYGGTWVDLQPLHTEGEGFLKYPDRKNYKLTQPVIPVGVGIKYNLSELWTFGFEIGTHVTFTDYIDDVSKTYISRQDFDAFFADSPDASALAYALSVRSGEHDPEGVHGNITAPDQQRGNAGHNDQYVTAQITIAYVFPLNGWFKYYYHQYFR